MGFLHPRKPDEPQQQSQGAISGGRGEALVDQQLQQNKAELEGKKQSLFKTRLDILRGQGGQNWKSNKI